MTVTKERSADADGDFFFAGARAPIQLVLREFFPAAPAGVEPHAHPGVEFIYALTGTLSVHIDGEEHALEAGDSIYFDSSLPHGYGRSGGRPVAPSS